MNERKLGGGERECSLLRLEECNIRRLLVLKREMLDVKLM